MDSLARLDVLIYAHDGRGLGHVSRSAAVGLALKRLYPELKVCLVTGSRQTQELIGPAPLDWLKLPAYETRVVDGVSRGTEGKSGFGDRELGILRSRQLKDMIDLYQPRLLLADHSPQGKHGELLPALEALRSTGNTTCILGIRGVVGGVSQLVSPLAQETFEKYYDSLLWYGDSRVLGDTQKTALETRFDTSIFECGYVSRLKELEQYLSVSGHPNKSESACTVSVPWFGENSRSFLEILDHDIRLIGPGYGQFRIFVADGRQSLPPGLLDMGFCRVESFGYDYVSALLSAKTALIFGGYNSLVDVLAKQIPAVVILREMQDREQQDHLDCLGSHVRTMTGVSEAELRPGLLKDLLEGFLQKKGKGTTSATVNTDGAEQAACIIKNKLEE